MTDVRLAATQILSSLLQHQGSLSSLLPNYLKQVSARDTGLLQQLVYGTTREYFRLDALAQHLLKKPFQVKDSDLHACLLLGLYQLRELRIPEHAVIHETVELAKRLNKEWATGLINAVLRRYQREAVELDQQLSQQSDLYHWNHPEWMITKLQHNWPDHWQQILIQNDIRAPMTLRVNKRLLTPETLQNKLVEEGIDAQLGQLSSQAVILEEPVDVLDIPGFDLGECSVQDEAAQLSVQLLDVQPGERVLDACAAPGGKLCHLLEHHADSATQIDAVELNPKRMPRIYENLERLHLAEYCRVFEGDASAHDWWDGVTYDRILVDAPCSGSGVIRRNPDIKLLRQNEDLLKLASLQMAILENLWQMLKPGGTLVYATCSIFPQENERIVERFCKQHLDAHHQPLNISAGLTRPFGTQFFPQLNSHDGFFYAKLTKLDANGISEA
ncbi:MAG: 16S rRNA (cytosine(967)-C(5))-methyltransferase RsmB [Oceanospirillales bacterium]|nr:MAG: 16S rRNA (cytosine(967)-C(5))-methyltransferase RsmB [Oceanospirillales bacterium]